MPAANPTIYAANESSVLVDGQPISGVQSVDYRYHRARTNLYALGSPERVGVTSGPYSAEGRLRVASASAEMDALGSEQVFQVIANLKQGDTTVTVTFDDCVLVEKSFDIGVGGHGEAVYGFTAVRVREER
jgi:hypothetical protein